MLAVSLNISFCKSEVKNKYFVGGFIKSNTEIIGLDVSMDEVPIMHILNPCDHLIDKHEDSFERKSSEGLIEQGL